ncbi:MAG: hypothetical protein ACXW3Z_04285 [Limisphaerales bacterium]
MVWVKRNLGLVIGGAVALALLVVAGVYLFSKRGEDQAVTGELDAATARFQELLSRPVHPGDDQGRVNNIEIAKEEVKRLQGFLTEVRSKFGGGNVPTNISNREFRALLDNTVNDLQKTAESLGITLPQNDYWFTFAPQRTSVEFKSIEMLTHQLLDVKELCEILYQAKVQDLKGIRRVPASTEDNNTQDFITDKKAATNEVAIVTPYELKFQGFSAELARVLDRLVQAKRCFVVRSVAVDRAPEDQPANTAAAYPMPNPMSRYGGRYTPAPVAVAPRPTRPGNVLLDENKLLIEIRVDVVRLKDPGPAVNAERQVAQQTQ